MMAVAICTYCIGCIDLDYEDCYFTTTDEQYVCPKCYEERKIDMRNEDDDSIMFQLSVDDAYVWMSEGQRQHMANKLNKHGYRPQNINGHHVEVDGKEYILVPVEA
jgi:hypothetical protein